MMPKKFETKATIGLILIAIIFFLVEGSYNKLITGGILFLYMGGLNLFEWFESNRKDHISFYGSMLMFSMGILALGLVYLLPINVNLFAYTFGSIVFLEFIYLWMWGPNSFFKKVLFTLFFLPLIWAVYSLFVTFFSIGINGLKIPDIVIAILAILTFILIYWAILSFFNKIFPTNKITSFLMSKKAIFGVLILLLFFLLIGFKYGQISIKSISAITSDLPWLNVILIISSILSFTNIIPNKKDK